MTLYRKISQLPVGSQLVKTDVIEVSQQLTGTPISRQMSIGNVWLSSNFVPPRIAGNFYDFPGNELDSSATGLVSGSAGRADLGLAICRRDFAYDQIGPSVSTGAASAVVRALIYDVDANGWPGALLYAQPSQDASTSGFKATTTSGTLEQGRPYWLGVLCGTAGPTLRAAALSKCLNLGGVGTSNTGVNCLVRISRSGLTFASPPDPWVFNAAELSSNAPPLVRFRAA